MPQLWFEVLSSVALGVALLSCAYLFVTVVRHPQQMAVMNWVWPITALYFGPVAILAYRQLGRPGPSPPTGRRRIPTSRSLPRCQAQRESSWGAV